MIRKIVLVGVCCCLMFVAWSQEIKKKQYQFHSINSLAMLNGDNGISAAIQTVNGFTKGQWFAGIGVGLDYYRYRSAPVFADLRREFGQKKNKFFLYGNAGVNCSWVQKEFYITPTRWNGERTNNFNNGLYTDAGIGLKAGSKNSNAFILSLGYSRKSMVERVSYTDGWSGRELEDVNRYRFNRVAIKMGFWF
jgi:hypothetical protein